MTADVPQPSSGKPAGRRGWILPLLLILAVFIGLQWWRAQPLASGPAPGLAGRLLDGTQLDLAHLRGEPVLVHFWASWCPVCRMGEGGIDAIAEDHAVVTVAMQSGGPGEIGRYLREAGRTFPVLPDPYGELASRWGVQGVPASFVLDGAGRIRFATMGYTTEVGLRGRLWAASQLD